jgi:regulator of protease activity HflC (stomatin/prohibitin superfamily)
MAKTHNPVGHDKESLMFGIRYIKSQPTVHLMQYAKGRVVRQGVGQSFFYYAPASTVVAVPVASLEQPFMLTLVTADFQSVTLQGKVTYRVDNPQLTASLMDFSLAADGKTYASEDPERLGGRVATQVEVIIQQQVQAMPLKQAIRASADIARSAQRMLGEQAGMTSLGLEVLGVSVQAVKPTPDIARALEAEAREANLKAADDAIYLRRMAAVEKERSIRENELDTEVAVEDKQRQIEEARMAAKASVMRKENALRTEQMDADVALEESRKAYVNGQAANTRTLADAEAHRMTALMKALQLADPRVLQALASMGMAPGQLIAQAFGGIAEKAEKIGQLNMSPELLNSLLRSAPATTR